MGALFERKPELFFSIGGTVPIAEVLRSQSLDEFKRIVLDEYIEGIRRKSYVEQFETFEKLFDVSTLRKFENWQKFIEVAQRRNLIAHCGGVVSDQYLLVCRREGFQVDQGIQRGSKLEVDDAYFDSTCLLIKEVGLKLAQTLWRKVLPEEVQRADDHLRFVAYEALQAEAWDWAEIVGQFALGQKHRREERTRLVLLVNLALALKFGGKQEAALSLISSQDWSASEGDFKLAAAVIRDNFEEAAAIMRRIGQAGGMLNKASYHEWPLFREFRLSPEFLSAYESIYEHPFIAELRVEARVEAYALEMAQPASNQAGGD